MASSFAATVTFDVDFVAQQGLIMRQRRRGAERTETARVDFDDDLSGGHAIAFVESTFINWPSTET
jgi:hypothetical protein